jgi:hypothetical protein
MFSPGIKPGRWLYSVACLMVLTGMVTFGGLLWKAITGMTKSLTQVVLPGSAEVQLDVGPHLVFYEFESVVGNRVFSTPASLPGVECRLISKEAGTKVPLYRPNMSTTYTVGGRSGQSVLSFRITKPGAYVFTASYPDNQPHDNVVFAIGPDPSSSFIVTILASIASFFVLCGVGALIGALTLIKRREAKKLLSRAKP